MATALVPVMVMVMVTVMVTVMTMVMTNLAACFRSIARVSTSISALSLSSTIMHMRLISSPSLSSNMCSFSINSIRRVFFKRARRSCSVSPRAPRFHGLVRTRVW